MYKPHKQILCHGILVDELLKPIFEIIWPLGINTLYSCLYYDSYSCIKR